ncbi:MAG: disulfide bond formation protein DsbA [Cyanobacteria bacterium 13_1_40CM_2_61_4]|nr:MAG: disulfide bond formation protein DsbA [Cyanobacteria bacterium 13_1_40CM_2_61_4]
MATSMRAKIVLPVSERDHVQGAETAPVTLVEYGDFECPYCGAAYLIVKKIRQVMGDQLRFVFRHFPLTQMHPHAESAAEAAEAAGVQGRFWQMHDLLFENQHTLDPWHLLGFAEELGLDTERFGRELEDGVHRERVRADFLSGIRSGVNGTPAFFINDIRYDGSWDIPPLLEALERAGAAKASAAKRV